MIRIAVLCSSVFLVACESSEVVTDPGFSLGRMVTATRDRITWRAPDDDPKSFQALYLEPLRVRASAWSAGGTVRVAQRGVDTTVRTYDRVFRGMLADTIRLVDRPAPGVLVVSASLTGRVEEPHLKKHAQRFRLADERGQLGRVGLEMLFRRAPSGDLIAAALSLEGSHVFPAAIADQDPDPARAFVPLATALKLALSRSRPPAGASE